MSEMAKAIEKQARWAARLGDLPLDSPHIRRLAWRIDRAYSILCKPYEPEFVELICVVLWNLRVDPDIANSAKSLRATMKIAEQLGSYDFKGNADGVRETTLVTAIEAWRTTPGRPKAWKARSRRRPPDKWTATARLLVEWGLQATRDSVQKVWNRSHTRFKFSLLSPRLN